MNKLLKIIIVALLCAMCGTVSYVYCDISWGIKYAGYSAPTYVAFLYAIPFTIGILICLIILYLTNKKK